jgi:hypothetical protein
MQLALVETLHSPRQESPQRARCAHGAVASDPDKEGEFDRCHQDLPAALYNSLLPHQEQQLALPKGASLKLLWFCGAVSPKKLKFECVTKSTGGEGLSGRFLVDSALVFNDFFVIISEIFFNKSLAKIKMKALMVMVEARDMLRAI